MGKSEEGFTEEEACIVRVFKSIGDYVRECESNLERKLHIDAARESLRRIRYKPGRTNILVTPDGKTTYTGGFYLAEDKQDKGSHYRYSFKAKISQEDIDQGYTVVNLDPYRICDIYKVGGGPREHITKKCLRWVEKGHSEQDLIDELQCCLDRWKQMKQEEIDES